MGFLLILVNFYWIYCDLNTADLKARTLNTGINMPRRIAKTIRPVGRPRKRRSVREVLATNMVKLRHDLGWSQEDLAFEADLHRTFIAHVERQVRNISLDNVEKIADALGVGVAELFSP